MRTIGILSTGFVLLACSAGDPTKTPTATDSVGLTPDSHHVKTPQYDYTVFDSPKGNMTTPTGLNDDGVIAAFEQQDVANYFTAAEAVVFQNGQGSVIDTPNYLGVQTTGINNAGQMVMNYYTAEDAANFTWHNAIYNIYSKSWTYLLPASNVFPSAGNAINDQGQVLGESYEWVGGIDGYINNVHGWLWDGHKYTTLPDVPGTVGACGGTEPFAINNKGEIGGLFMDAPDGVNCAWHGFLRSGSVYTTIDPPNDDCGAAVTGINDQGVLVGLWSSFQDGCVNHAFLWREGVFTVFDFPFPQYPYGSVWISGINNEGVIVGYFVDSAGLRRGFMGVPHHGP